MVISIPSQKKAMIHISQLHKIVERGEFSVKFVKTNGELVSGKRVICSSFHSEGSTINLKFLESGQIRKVRRCTITEINGEEVVL